MAIKLLVYAMASSGASTFCLFLGQLPGSVAVVDLWGHCVAPALNLKVPAVVKATATMTYHAEDHMAHFQPDRTILFLRDPVAVYASLKKYHYADEEGTLEEKLARFDAEYVDQPFDLILRYEDFVARDPSIVAALIRLGWPSRDEHYNFARSIEEIFDFNLEHSLWLNNEYQRSWGFGNFRGTELRRDLTPPRFSDETIAAVAEIAPRLCRAYGYLPAG